MAARRLLDRTSEPCPGFRQHGMHNSMLRIVVYHCNDPSGTGHTHVMVN
jgi:hypothetical protein